MFSLFFKVEMDVRKDAACVRTAGKAQDVWNWTNAEDPTSWQVHAPAMERAWTMKRPPLRIANAFQWIMVAVFARSICLTLALLTS